MPLLDSLYLIVGNYSFPQRENKLVGDTILYSALSLPKAIAEHFRVMRMLLLLTFLALGAADVGAIALESPLKRLVAETLTLLSTHRTLLIGEGVIFFLSPTVFKRHR